VQTPASLGSGGASIPIDENRPRSAVLSPMPDSPPRPASVEWLILDLLLEHRHRSWGIGELVDAVGSPI
jgi:hypothetical protein